MVFVIIGIVAIVVIWYVVQHQGQSTTVHNPTIGAVDPQHIANQGADSFAHFATSQGGAILLGILIVTAIAIGVWRQLSKGMVAALILLIAVGWFGVAAGGHH